MIYTCSYCEIGTLSEVTYAQPIKAGRRTVNVEGLSKLVCSHCGEESIPLAMYDRNAKLVEDALLTTSAAVTRGLLRQLRDQWNVTQREASMIFGAGESAFAKWESGQARMSEPSALLVQCAISVPGAMEYLAKLADVQVTSCHSLRMGRHSANRHWAYLKDAPAPEIKRPVLTLVSVKPSRVPTPPPFAWKNDYQKAKAA